MAAKANITRRGALTMLSAVAISAAFVSAPSPASVTTDFEEIAQAWAVMAPLERKFIYDQLHASHLGEPNLIDKTADYTFEEWAGDIEPWERDMIAKAFQSPDIRTY